MPALEPGCGQVDGLPCEKTAWVICGNLGTKAKTQRQTNAMAKRSYHPNRLGCLFCWSFPRLASFLSGESGVDGI